MAYEYVILKDQQNGLDTRWIEAYVRNTPNPEVRLCSAQIGLNAPLNIIDLPTVFAAGTIVPNGAALWNQLDLEATDDIGRGAIGAILDVVRSSGTLAQMVTAGTGAIAGDVRQTAAYTRISTALIAGTNAERMQFVALMAVISYSKIGQRKR